MKKIIVISIILLIAVFIIKDAFLFYRENNIKGLDIFNLTKLAKTNNISNKYNQSNNKENDAEKEKQSNNEVKIENSVKSTQIVIFDGVQSVIYEKAIDDWRLTLVNYDNYLESDFEVELANIDSSKQFDKRALGELKQMLADMKAAGYKNIWPQSAYRSIDRQKELYEKSIKKYMNKGETYEAAENLTRQLINKPGTSEHNLGLAIDFNNVDYKFGQTKEFEWLMKNAENYGFILRYRKDKEEITKVRYEPWHWRYVGVENAKKINELDMCLEEYVDYKLKELNG